MSTRLTKMQQKFVDVFAGNATEAARIAGYKNPEVQGSRTLGIVSVQNAISKREMPARKRRIADRDERLEFLTDTMHGEVVMRGGKNEGEPIPAAIEIQHRLKAVELLGKAHGDFVDRQEITAEYGLILPSEDGWDKARRGTGGSETDETPDP